MEKIKKKTKFKRCPVCKTETIAMICCKKLLKESYAENKPKSKRGESEE